MKAVILAGGKGTRGKPYTEYFPKAMTPINGKPLIDYVLKYLKSFSFIDEIFIVSDFNAIGGKMPPGLPAGCRRSKSGLIEGLFSRLQIRPLRGRSVLLL